jgi:hypothetical protein
MLGWIAVTKIDNFSKNLAIMPHERILFGWIGQVNYYPTRT